MLKIGVIISSTRETRYADKPAQWIFDLASQRDDLAVELIDLRDFNLPFFNEMASNAWVPTQSPEALAWQKKIGEMDGFIFVVAEYNRSITGALKNALDQAYVEWNRKPAGYVGYGSMGAARAIEQLRLINIELQLVPTRSAVHIGASDFFKVHPLGGVNAPLSEIAQVIEPAAKDMLDQLTWLGNALKTARENDSAADKAA
ncbi:MAG: NAD(P)H-dependent oxidoreductase [Hyphomicrobiaceae bacterium]|nr:NAD(P)H-dependent oxidoreductase [Hyphomicrobiaceae bacterium]MCC0022949.1 NAD(P)H-dependent oxidoreductase [Hyphomicrobiaceae bacterium]